MTLIRLDSMGKNEFTLSGISTCMNVKSLKLTLNFLMSGAVSLTSSTTNSVFWKPENTVYESDQKAIPPENAVPEPTNRSMPLSYFWLLFISS